MKNKKPTIKELQGENKDLRYIILYMICAISILAVIAYIIGFKLKDTSENLKIVQLCHKISIYRKDVSIDFGHADDSFCRIKYEYIRDLDTLERILDWYKVSDLR
jgi:hypothetical protein